MRSSGGASAIRSMSGTRKSASGIQGFDEITGGGLPTGRTTLIVGGPGSGKTLFGLEFIVNGILKYGEPGVFFSFEESDKELAENSVSIGLDLKKLIDKNKLFIDYVRIEPEKIIETGEYDLEGLFIRLNNAIDTIGAKRVVLDTVEVIFSSFGRSNIIRSEMGRLFRFLKDKGVTAVVTGESGEKTLSRHGLEEYISDMVISLDHRVVNEIATRRLRIVKYRGSAHGTNEYPFIIESDGISVLPITSAGLDAKASLKRVSSGIPDLDEMLGGRGYFEGSTILVTGSAGTGKTSVAASFAREACRRGKKVLYVHFEESPSQIVRNMQAIGLNLGTHVRANRLMIYSDRPTSVGLEMHLAKIHKIVSQFDPDIAIFDPASSLNSIGTDLETKSALVRLADFLKMRGTTTMLTDLNHAAGSAQESIISSVVDTWILLQDNDANGEKNRVMRIVKSRGMAHSNQLREFKITSNGIRILPSYIGVGGVLTGTARFAQESRERAEDVVRKGDIERLKRSLEHQRKATEVKIAALKSEIDEKELELEKRILEEKARRGIAEDDQKVLGRMRMSSRGEKVGKE